MGKPVYEKHEEGYVVGIDMDDTVHLIEVGKLVEKGEAKRMNMYFDGKHHYIVKQKLSE